jgi:hypothetical protein
VKHDSAPLDGVAQPARLELIPGRAGERPLRVGLEQLEVLASLGVPHGRG